MAGTYDDVMICEDSIGSDGADLTEEQIDAWGRIVRSGLAFQLQGMFGRYARYLLEEGYLNLEETN